MMVWTIGISVFLAVFYVTLIGYYALGWAALRKHYKPIQTTPDSNLRYSILIPARNEEQVIEACLFHIIQQEFSKSQVEIIVLDDHSTDQTCAKARSFAAQNADWNIRVISLLDVKHKKEAITLGVQQAQGDYVILTDADCTRGPKWLATIDAYIRQTQAVMISAPVLFSKGNVFENIQVLEYAGLSGIGAAAIYLKKPNMCSAANLIFRKDVFNEVGGYNDNLHIASGDDEYLLHKVCKAYPNHVVYLPDRRAIVETPANKGLEELSNQRRRWVSKSTRYAERYITLILILAYLFNAAIVLLLFWGGIYTQMALILFAVKFGIEWIFLSQVVSFYQRQSLIWLLPLAELVHIPYVLIIGIWANLGKYTWKERKHS